MIIQKTSVFPAPRDAAFQKLQRPETLQTIAKPYAAFEPVDSAAAVWTVGGKSSYLFCAEGSSVFLGSDECIIEHFGRVGKRVEYSLFQSRSVNIHEICNKRHGSDG